MWHTILLILGAIFASVGVVFVYDARVITIKMFGFGDQNEASLGLKMIGFIFCLIGSFIILINT